MSQEWEARQPAPGITEIERVSRRAAVGARHRQPTRGVGCFSFRLSGGGAVKHQWISNAAFARLTGIKKVCMVCRQPNTTAAKTCPGKPQP